MLKKILIQNYTIVPSLELSFQAGLNVITGETGAGKSIIVDAINLALGARGNLKCLGQASANCVIQAHFDLSHNPPARAWLKQHQFAHEHQPCIIKRTLSRQGISRSTINNQACPQHLMRQFAGLVLAIHGQHQQQDLLKQSSQQHYLDQFADNHQLVHKIEQLHCRWQQLKQELDQQQQQLEQRDQQLNFFQYQLDELKTLDLQKNEWEKLHHEHQQLHHAKQIIHHLHQALELTRHNEQHSVTQLLQSAIDKIGAVKSDDPQLQSVYELLNTAAIHVQEASDELDQYHHNLDLSPTRLHQVEQRLTVIHDCARKHHVAPTELPNMIQSLEQQCAALQSLDQQITQLQEELQLVEGQYHHIAQQLQTRRQQAQTLLSEKMTTLMQRLGMQGGSFTIALQTSHPQQITRYGYEQVIFKVSTNPGQPIRPLTQVVSGGELSRLSLACQVIIAKRYNVPTLVFDEVDVGIGGKTAATVGELLRELSQHTQVFCITHLPQVAAQGHHHYLVDKHHDNNATVATLNLLNKEARVKEIARMLSGERINTPTLAHAAELIGDTQ